MARLGICPYGGAGVVGGIVGAESDEAGFRFCFRNGMRKYGQPDGPELCQCHFAGGQSFGGLCDGVSGSDVYPGDFGSADTDTLFVIPFGVRSELPDVKAEVFFIRYFFAKDCGFLRKLTSL